MAIRIQMPGSLAEVVCDTVSEALAFIEATKRPRRVPRADAMDSATADRIAAWLCRWAAQIDPTKEDDVALVSKTLEKVAEKIRLGAYWPALDETRKPKSKTA